MYQTFLYLHSYLRWVVLLLALVAIVKYASGLSSNKTFTEGDRKIGLFYMISMDVMLLIGLVLYLFLSPITQAAFADFGAAMKEKALRFWAVEHFLGMIIALVLTHIGYSRIKKPSIDKNRFRTGLIFFGLSLLVMLLSIPWPFREIIGRQLFPM